MKHAQPKGVVRTESLARSGVVTTVGGGRGGCPLLGGVVLLLSILCIMCIRQGGRK